MLNEKSSILHINFKVPYKKLDTINAILVLFFEPLAHTNNNVNSGADNAQSENKLRKINPIMILIFFDLDDIFSIAVRIKKHINKENNIFNPTNSNIPFLVKARQYGISEIMANINNLKAYFFLE